MARTLSSSSPRKRGPRASGTVHEATFLASQRNGTLYIGVTSDIVRRVWEHRNGVIDGFTKEYGVHRLVYTEFHETMTDAIAREKQMKKWRRAWKLELIEQDNPTWRDLYDEFVGCPGSPLARG